MRKLCGYDLNGWRDFGCRNWLVRPDGDEEEVSCSVSHGGICGVVVRVGDGQDTQFVGGAQAMLAPHGLGAGWGDIGKEENRLKIIDILSDADPKVEVLAKALTGLVPGSGFGVASIDDEPGSSELLQDRLLKALRKARISSPLLVWRPVLAALYAIETGAVDRPMKIGVLCHSAKGFALQTLQIRMEGIGSSGILAPERSRSGEVLESGWGYAPLLERAHEALRTSAMGGAPQSIAWAKASGRMILGLPTQAEMLRLDNGDWQMLVPPGSLPLDGLPPPDGLRQAFRNCDLLLFETLSEGVIRERLTTLLAPVFEKPVFALPPDAVAIGAMIGARRYSSQEPVYFDFLPQISTIIQSPEGPESYDLVDPGTTLRAGETFRSPKPAQFAIQAGQERFSIYIRKQTADRPRKVTIRIGAKLSKQTPVDAWVEQRPASGSAKIQLMSSDLAQQFQADWDSAEELPQTWEDLLASFEKPAPTIPSRLILPCGMNVWHDNARGDGLLKIVADQVTRAHVDWKALADKMAARPFGHYALSSDGEFPGEIDEATRTDVHRLIERAMAHVRQRLAGKIDDDNQSLRFLTWLFRLCPPEVTVWLLEAWDQQVRGHRLMTHGSHWKLAYQGLGRIVSKGSHEQQAIHTILRKRIDEWTWQRETAAMAFMLSRSDTAPRALSRKDVERIARRVILEFKDNIGSNYNRFQYAPFLLVGLLRWRLVEPFALVAGHDPTADGLMRAVEITLKDLNIPSRAKAKAKYGRILEQVVEELAGSGTNPDLLLDIASGGDDSDT